MPPREVRKRRVLHLRTQGWSLNPGLGTWPLLGKDKWHQTLRILGVVLREPRSLGEWGQGSPATRGALPVPTDLPFLWGQARHTTAARVVTGPLC